MAKKLREIIKKTAHSKGDEKFTKDHLSGRNSVSYKNDKPTENDKQFTTDVVSIQDTDPAHKGSVESSYDSVNESLAKKREEAREKLAKNRKNWKAWSKTPKGKKWAKDTDPKNKDLDEEYEALQENRHLPLDEGLGEGPLLPTKKEMKMGMRVAGKQWKAAGKQLKGMLKGAVCKEDRLDELSRKMLGSYIKQAKDNLTQRSNDAADKLVYGDPYSGKSQKKSAELERKKYARPFSVSKKDQKARNDDVNNWNKRDASIDLAVNKISNTKPTKGSGRVRLKYGNVSWPGNKARVLAKEETLNEGLGHGARELTLFADNDANLHRQSHEPIMKNLALKHKKGKYDHEKAKKLWGYHADRAAQAYHKQFGSKDQPWHKMFSTADRKEAAAHWADHHRPDQNNEETLHELSKKTLSSYFNKAEDSASSLSRSWVVGAKTAEEKKKAYAKIDKKVDNRMAGMDRVIDRLKGKPYLAKEEVDPAWQKRRDDVWKKIGDNIDKQVAEYKAKMKTYPKEEPRKGGGENWRGVSGPSGSKGFRVKDYLEEGHGMFRANTFGTNNEAENDGKKYKIIRFHRNGTPKTVARGVSLSYAKSHCSHPETSSSTCAGKNGKAYTRRHGDWFDGYDKQ
jgi:hypothetical protein